jgi:hypothetical protein
MEYVFCAITLVEHEMFLFDFFVFRKIMQR